MGDRANVQVQDNGKRVNLYSHWQGSELPEIVRTALARNQRWNDASYLARIIFCTMVGDQVDGETGFGISLDLPDNEWPIIVVDCDKQEVYIEADTRKGFDYCKPKGPPKSFSFADFAKLEQATWKSLDPKRKGGE